MNYINKQVEFGVAVEETRGTPETTADRWVKKGTLSLFSKSEKVVDPSTLGILTDSENRRIVRKWFDGELSGIVHADSIGYFIYNLFGDVSSAQLSGVCYGHTFEIDNDLQHPSLSLFIKDGVEQQVLNNGMVKNLEITAVQEDLVRFKANIVASDTASNSDTPSYASEYDFIGKDITVKVSDTLEGLTGASALSLKGVNISFDQAIVSDFVLGSYNPDDNYNTSMAIEGSFTKNHADSTFEDLNNTDTAKYMSITIEGPTAIAGGYKPKISVVLHKVLITDWIPNSAGDGLAEESVSFKAFYNSTTSKQAVITLQNKTEEYSKIVSA